VANEKNLIPFTSEQSREEAKKNGHKGGVASGKARKEKASLRKMAQAILDGTFSDTNGQQFSGLQLVQRGLMANLGNPNGRNWGRAMEFLLALTGATVSDEQKAHLKAATEKMKAETRRIEGGSGSQNGMLEELIKGLREDVHTETESPDADVAEGRTEADQPT
jgi:hypothetical protein